MKGKLSLSDLLREIDPAVASLDHIESHCLPCLYISQHELHKAIDDPPTFLCLILLQYLHLLNTYQAISPFIP